MEAALPFTSIVRLTARSWREGAANAVAGGRKLSTPVAAPADRICRREKDIVIINNLQIGLILFRAQSPEGQGETGPPKVMQCGVAAARLGISCGRAERM
jgi:hypothetical protein